MGILSWILVGLVAGGLANMVYPAPAKGGWLAAMMLGIVGAMVGGFLFGMVTGQDVVTGFNLTSIGVAVIGALVLLFGYNAVQGERSHA